MKKTTEENDAASLPKASPDKNGVSKPIKWSRGFGLWVGC